jgi:TfoX/Sxy family transcriptional regulator of competence genes
MSDAQQQFHDIVASFSGTPGVEPPSGTGKFGGMSLKVNGSIFAMLASNEDFVVKLPKKRVDELVVSGMGQRFDPRRNGRVMKEWFVVSTHYADEWLSLAREAEQFVGK